MASTTTDKRLTAIENDRKKELSNIDNTYNNMIDSTDQFYQNQADAINQYEQTQKENQQQNTDFAIEKIEQQKDKTTEEYNREQSAAYVDWQKQSNDYSANAEQKASSGLSSSGYSESSKVSMYNTYQNRITTARKNYDSIILDYNNGIKEAQIANNSALAEIAYNSLMSRLQLALEGFKHKNTLLQTQLEMKNSVNSRFDSKYLAMLNQINSEKSLAEQKREFNLTYKKTYGSRASGGSGGNQKKNEEITEGNPKSKNSSRSIAPVVGATIAASGVQNAGNKSQKGSNKNTYDSETQGRSKLMNKNSTIFLKNSGDANWFKKNVQPRLNKDGYITLDNLISLLASSNVTDAGKNQIYKYFGIS